MLRLADPPAADVRRAMQEVFGRDEFQRSRSWFQRAVDWLMEKLFGNSTPSAGSAPAWGGPIATIVVWVVGALLAAFLAFLIYRIVRTWSPRAKRRSTEPTVEVQEVRTVAEWAGDAERFEAEGDWKEAIRCRYRELVGRLIDAKVVPALPGRTTGELRGDVAASIEAVDAAFDEATLLFELPWFAHAETGPAENRRFRELATEVVAAAERMGRVELVGATVGPNTGPTTGDPS